MIILIFQALYGKRFAQKCEKNDKKCRTLKENTELAQIIDSDVKEINYAGSNLAFFPIEVFNHFLNMEKLDLHGHKIKTIRRDAFKNASKLRYLDLGSNNLDSLKNISFGMAKQLETLIVSSNYLTSIEPTAFDGL